MTLDDAKGVILAGAAFGAAYPLLTDAADGAALREWYVREPAVPVRRDRPPARQMSTEQVKAAGYSGEPCGKCGGVRTTRAGACLRCEDCGESGCS